MNELQINSKFRDVVRPLKPDEFNGLEETILRDGRVYSPIITWKGIIIDGHNRWAIIQKHPEIPYTVQEMDFPDEWAVIAWICNTQLGRRNLTDEERTYTIGKQYEAEKMSVGGNGNNQHKKEELPQSEAIPKPRTSERIAKQHGIGHAAVERAEKFAKGVDAAEKISPGAKDTILSGVTKVPKKVIAELPKMEAEQQQEVVQKISSGMPWDKPKSQDPTPKGMKQTIAEVAASLYNTEKVVEHTVDDLLEELALTIEEFDRKTRRSIRIYQEDYKVVLSEDDTNKLIAVLSEAEKAIQKIKETI